MKKVTWLLLTLAVLCALLVGLLASCGSKSDITSDTTTLNEGVGDPLPELDYNEVKTECFDYSFSFGNFVKSCYNAVGNPLSRVYYIPTTMKASPLSFAYRYNAKGKLIDVTMGEGGDKLVLSATYDSKGYPKAATSGEASIFFTCDDSGRILSESLGFVIFVYDTNGRLVSELGSAYSGSYEITTVHSGHEANVEVKTANDDAFSLTITYLENGYPAAMTGVIDGVEPWQYTSGLTVWEYNEQALCTLFSMTHNGEEQRIEYVYDEKGELVKKRVSAFDKNGDLIEKNTYDKDGNPIADAEEPEQTTPSDSTTVPDTTES